MHTKSLVHLLILAVGTAAGCWGAQSYTITTIAGTYSAKGPVGTLGDGGPATSAGLYGPGGLAVDTSGNLYIADQYNNRIRKVSPVGIITTFAGSGKAVTECTGTGAYNGDGGPATDAALNCPSGVALDSVGILYIADSGNNVVRKVAQNGTISTYAGTGKAGYSGDGNAAAGATLNQPSSLAIGPDGSVYISDTGNNVVRKVSTSGVISTVAGNGMRSFSGDGGPAVAAGLCCQGGIAVDQAGRLFIADGNDVVRMVSLNGSISTVAGDPTGAYEFSGDGGAAIKASFQNCSGVAVDSAGNLFITDVNSNRIREVTTDGIIWTIAGNGIYIFQGDGGSAIDAGLQSPMDLVVAGGKVYVSDRGHNLIRLLTPNAASTPPTILPGGVVTLFSKSSTVQPGSWVSIYGNNLTTGTAPVTWNGDYPILLDDTRVTINNKPAYLSYASPTLINLQASDDVARGPVSVTVATALGTATATITLADQGPSFSLLGDGLHVAGIILRTDGSGTNGRGVSSYDVLGPTGSSLGYRTVAARAGDTVALFGVGFGPTTPAIPAGKAYIGLAGRANGMVNMSIGGKSITPAFVGVQIPGLFQLNVTVPSGLGSGDQPLIATINGSSTQSSVVLAVQ